MARFDPIYVIDCQRIEKAKQITYSAVWKTLPVDMGSGNNTSSPCEHGALAISESACNASRIFIRLEFVRAARD